MRISNCHANLLPFFFRRRCPVSALFRVLLSLMWSVVAARLTSGMSMTMGNPMTHPQQECAVPPNRPGVTEPASLRWLASTALMAFVLGPAVVCAGDRFAFGTGGVPDAPAVLDGGRVPDDVGQRATATAAAPGYHLSGALLGPSDSIFADGFEQTIAYQVIFANNVPIGSSLVLLGSINVPAGSYVAFVRMQVQTGSEANPGNSYRFDCSLTPGFDNAIYRVGMTSSVERYLTFQGAATLAGPAVIQFSCRDGNGHTDSALSGKLTVISVASVN